MRRREEQRRKFHENLINMLYPPPSTPPSPKLESDQDEVAIGVSSHQVSNELGEEKSSATSGDDDVEGDGDGKPTRAQRKRMRKRKLKEEAVRRGKMIGPLLPEVGEDGSQGVRRNAAESFEVAEKPSTVSGKNKMKQRRRARKLAKTMTESVTKNKVDVVSDGAGDQSQSAEVK